MRAVRVARADELSALPQIERTAASLYDGWVPASRTAYTVPLAILDEARRAGRLFVATDEHDQPIGFAVVTLQGGLPHLEELDVLPEHGKQGHGSRLIEAVCSWAKSLGFGSLTLSTYVDVPFNAPFYRRRGFHEIPSNERPDRLNRVVENERAIGLPMHRRVLMRRDL